MSVAPPAPVPAWAETTAVLRPPPLLTYAGEWRAAHAVQAPVPAAEPAHSFGDELLDAVLDYGVYAQRAAIAAERGERAASRAANTEALLVFDRILALRRGGVTRQRRGSLNQE